RGQAAQHCEPRQRPEQARLSGARLLAESRFGQWWWRAAARRLRRVGPIGNGAGGGHRWWRGRLHRKRRGCHRLELDFPLHGPGWWRGGHGRRRRQRLRTRRILGGVIRLVVSLEIRVSLDRDPRVRAPVIDERVTAHVLTANGERKLLDRLELGFAPGGEADPVHRVPT